MIRNLILSILFVALCVSAQDNPRGEFYIKDQVKGFLSLKTDYQHFTAQSMSNLNAAIFREPWAYAYVGKDSAGVADTAWFNDTLRVHQYNQFGPSVLGMGFELGAQYHQLLTWFEIFLMPTQTSPVPNIRVKTGLRDVEWSRYGFEWNWGWMLFAEQAKFNVIPAAGFGFSVIDVKFPSNYDLAWNAPTDAQMQLYTLEDRAYSTFGKTVSGQIEARFNLAGGISVGGYAGLRLAWYDAFVIEKGPSKIYPLTMNTYTGDAWFIGGKVTYTMHSVWESTEKEKL